jgi:hypothetical protein
MGRVEIGPATVLGAQAAALVFTNDQAEPVPLKNRHLREQSVCLKPLEGIAATVVFRVRHFHSPNCAQGG